MARPALFESRVHADMHLIVPSPPRRLRAPADPGLQVDHSVALQQRFQRVELAFVDRAFRQHDHIDATDLLSGGDQHPVDEIQVEPFLRDELEEAERVICQPLDEPSTA